MEIDVRDSQDRARYEARVNGELAGFAQYRLTAGSITMFHTEIDAKYAGKGIGSELIGYALTDIRARGLELIPTCPFVAAYIAEHPDEYLDLVVPSMQERVRDLSRRA